MASISVPQWLQLDSRVRTKLKEVFNIQRSGVGHVNYTGQGPQVTSDGHTHEDLKAISVEAMQKYLGRLDTDYFDLFNAVLEHIGDGLRPVEDKQPTSSEMFKQSWVVNINSMRIDAEKAGLLTEFKKFLKSYK